MGVLLLVPSCWRCWASTTISLRSFFNFMAHALVADDYLLESGGPGYRSGLLLFFVLCAVVGVHFHGTRPAAEILSSGSDLRFFRGRGVLEFRQYVPSGLFGVRRKLRILRQYRWRLLKKGWVVSCSWPERSNMNDLS